MSDTLFTELDGLIAADGGAGAVTRLIDVLTERKVYDRLFDALLMQWKLQQELPLIQPTSSDDVPDDKLPEFEKAYFDAARKVGHLFLQNGQIPQGWVYLRYIHEPEPVREALDKLDALREASEETDELINVALYEGANPVKGLEIMLRVNGTCNTITALDQHIQQLDVEDRRKAAALMVRELYEDLTQTVSQEVQQKIAMLPPDESLRKLITGRDWLFEEGNYHIDVSHLNAVVRFARFLEPGDEELDKAMQLAEYGSKLAEQFQYPADPPFDDFYPAHLQFFKVLAEKDREAGLAYFRKKIDEEPEEEDKPMLAYVLVDLLIRIDRLSDALAVAKDYLQEVEDPHGFSFSKLCAEAGSLDTLRETARSRGDLVTYTATLLQASAG